VETLEFDTSIRLEVTVVRPGRYLADQRAFIGDALVQTLSSQDTELDLSHASPTACLGV
jgi:hypothetical protein